MVLIEMKIKMKRILSHTILPVILFFFLLGALEAIAKDVDFIIISGPTVKKTPIAVTQFKAMGNRSSEKREGNTARRILTDALNFTGYLKTMNPVAFLANPAETGIAKSKINFRDWTGIGADYLVTAGIREQSGKIRMELRLFDTINQKRLVGSVYTGSRSTIRTMIHRFCSDISEALTGNPGVFTSRIAFVSTVNGKKEIFACDFDGYDVRRLTRDKSICLSPAWSHDTRWISYVSYKSGRPQIYIKNLKENRGSIVAYKGLNTSPDWMPGQLKLAASLSFSGDQEIYLLTIKGETIKRVTRSWGIDVSPDFSPDGKKIVFTSKRTGTPQIYIKDIDSGKVRRLTFKGSNNTSPAWSPDGRYVAYVGIDKNKINIYRISSDGGEPVQLTQNQGDNEDPCWSPDGSMIVFTSTREGGISKIFVMNASGTDQRRLFSLKGRQSQPDWSNPVKED